MKWLSLNIMKEEMNKRKFIYIKIFLLMLAALCFVNKPMTARADGIPVSLGYVPFDEHRGMSMLIDGETGFCIQRGYPFRSTVSDIQMTRTVADNITMAEWIRLNLTNFTEGVGMEYFRGWGLWTLNGDHTNASQVSKTGAPSSDVIPEVFDKETEDFEDGYVPGKYNTSGSSPFDPFSITGHEGAKDKYATTLKTISESEAGFSRSQSSALAMLNYYIFEDSDASGYSQQAKIQVGQALAWAAEFNFVGTVGASGRSTYVTYKDSTGKYGTGGANSFSGSCDGYIKVYIGSQYEAMKLYRQVVWKTTNIRQFPSFAYERYGEAMNNPIHLKWDAQENAYVATIADGNGVLDYFEFSVAGVSCTNNGDGTLTLKSTGALSGAVASNPAVSKLLPDDCSFTLPTFYRWDLEGTNTAFNYAVLIPDLVFWSNSMNSYRHSHGWNPPCEWQCIFNGVDTNFCKNDKNAGKESNGHNDDCEDGCTEDHGSHFTRHEHVPECYHHNHCPYYLKTTTSRTTFNNKCSVFWVCQKKHYLLEHKSIAVKYIDWQDAIDFTGPDTLVDPVHAYISVITDEHVFPAETDTEILLIADNDEWNNLTYTAPNGKVIKHADHLRVGEKYHLKYIYSYKGASKGFRIEFSVQNKPYYQYNYLARMDAPYNNMPIYELRTGLSGDRFSKSSINVPHAKLVQDLTDITIRGLYTTPETAYTLNGAYTWDSEDSWNDQVYLDALVTDQFDDNYDNKDAGSITSNNGSPLKTDFTVSKPSHNDMLVVWEFDTEPEVFTSALVYGTAYIEVGENDNFTKNYFDEAYNYAKDKMTATAYTNWFYSFEEHNNVGGVGYFSSEYTGPGGPQSNNSIPAHTVYTQNNEYRTFAVKNKVWQSDVDIKVSNFVQNTGAGITEHIYQNRDRDNHDLNYNLYYTVDVVNPKATIYENKQRAHDGQTENDENTTPYDTTSDVNEFDVNTMISWGSTGASQTGASYGNTIVVDHIKTGRTYIQREIPTVLATMTALPKETMAMKIYPNHDRLIYEDHYTGAVVSGSDIGRTVSVSAKDGYYPPNEQSCASDIYPAMNPNQMDMRPQNISNSNNVPDQYNQDDNVLHHMAPTTSFVTKLSNGETKTIVDSHTKAYTQYDFEYNPSNRNDKVTFPSRRRSIMFFKYSKTNYSYNGRTVQSAVGQFKNAGKTQTESYYISQVLFKSNYTSKYKKELEAQGADYIEDKDVYGNLTDAWIDMVNQNKFAIVSAGQGFELRVTLKYENSFLTQYLARYFGSDDGQNDILGTSNRVQKRYNDVPANSRQYANISALTGKDGRNAPFYTSSARAYISSYSILDRLAVNLVTGANVFNDLYVFMSDNPDTVYSYSGIYNTPVIFERGIKYSADYSVTTITYTMCVSHENGISSNLQKMKFYTNQLAPDKRTPGIVEGTYDVAAQGEHSITIWTPVVAATPFDYPNTIQDRYIGDAIELGYTIKTTGADDSIVHIVQ